MGRKPATDRVFLPEKGLKNQADAAGNAALDGFRAFD